MTRKCRGAEYVIRVKNAGGGASGAKLTVDGKRIEGDLVPYAPPGSRVVIECEA